ncbi:MAG: uroporphyrinogen-III C-methyltransferase [Reyranella sp.]|uniref:siroheme synthase CysG n=1 Tax=Reyranella sp. TaxID=1929291 RepID=UPI0011FD0DC6|nr:siroheme synthase CysG [Reyranella sp.]TAJ41204.1 MAG: uroporphyrinogen-III C-methyltransferase [Reyranella sp.]
MQTFPLFMSLQGRRALVAGGTEAAARKVELLLSAGAQVSLIADTVVGEIAQLIDEGRISWAGRAFDEADLSGVSLVVVASDDEALQARVSLAAQQRCLPVNVVDRPKLSSFIMPAIVDRAPITIAISTGGAAPALARRLRAEIERAMPAAIGRLARFAEVFREQVRRTLEQPRTRRRFWDRVFEGRIAELALAGDEIGARRELIRLLDGTRHEAEPATGMVHLVGAGPGDPDLLTMKAHRLLQRADVVVYDRLVSAEVLAMARRDAERIYVGKRRAKHCLSQDEINHRLVALARAGKSVVRLKGGDPLVFGRGGEEIEALARAGVAVEVVPGVTAALGCAASAGIPLTHRDHAQACVFVTGHLKNGSVDLDWPMLARPRQTVVIYMGANSLPAIASQLVAHGLPASTPVALVENGTTDRERRVVGTLATIERQAMRAQLQGPTLCMVGEVVGLAMAQSGGVKAGEFHFESRVSL